MNYVIIAAGGKGTRFGGGVSKQLASLSGKPMLSWSLEVFAAETGIDQIILVHPTDESEGLYSPFLRLSGKITFVKGGTARYDSVRNGFESISGSNSDLVLIHDAARPLLSTRLVQRVLAAVAEKGAVIPALPVQETVKEAEEDRVIRTLPRDQLYLAQTPQGFRWDILKAAYSTVARSEDLTDEALLVEKAGFPVFLVTGEKENIKITDAEDVQLAEYYMQGGKR